MDNSSLKFASVRCDAGYQLAWLQKNKIVGPIHGSHGGPMAISLEGSCSRRVGFLLQVVSNEKQITKGLIKQDSALVFIPMLLELFSSCFVGKLIISLTRKTVETVFRSQETGCNVAFSY